ncbi:MAG: BREX system ATP-binding domain-containing protein [Longimicrobiales bacterium]
MTAVTTYLDFVADEYLGGFIREGGAAVKFVIAPDGNAADEMRADLRARAEAAGYVFALVDSAAVKVHMIDQVFYEIARQVPWDQLAEAVVVRTLNELKFAVPPDEPVSLEAIARHNRYDFQELRKEFNRRLQQEIFDDKAMAQEFRIAMMRLCQAKASAGPAGQAGREAVLHWLKGELKQIAMIKPHGIYQKIARHNARYMLFSLSRWLTKADRAGLVLNLDIRQCAVPARSLTEKLFYTKVAVMDVYEVLRQLIDATDEMTSCFALVTCGPDFISDPSRGVQQYIALRMRILDEVRDRTRTNPFASMIRLERDMALAGGRS